MFLVFLSVFSQLPCWSTGAVVATLVPLNWPETAMLLTVTENRCDAEQTLSGQAEDCAVTPSESRAV